MPHAPIVIANGSTVALVKISDGSPAVGTVSGGVANIKAQGSPVFTLVTGQVNGMPVSVTNGLVTQTLFAGSPAVQVGAAFVIPALPAVAQYTGSFTAANATTVAVQVR